MFFLFCARVYVRRSTVVIGDPVRGSCKRTGFRDVVFNVYVVSHHKRTPYIIPYPLVFDLLYTPELLLVLALQSLRVTGKGAFQRWREARVFVKAFLLSHENAIPYDSSTVARQDENRFCTCTLLDSSTF